MITNERNQRVALSAPVFRISGARSDRGRGIGFLSALCVWVLALQGTGAAAQENLPLVEKGDLVYQGAFRVPGGGDDSSTFSWGGESMGYNPINDSLFLVGHTHHQRSAEISIPELTDGTNLGDLETADFLQTFADATEGKRSQINPGDSNSQRIGGHLVYGGRLIVSAFSYYDAQGSQSGSHFVRPLSLSSSGQVKGPFRVGNDAHYTSAYMAAIPPEWQDALGGPALTGNCCRAIIANHSYGPAVSVFDPDDLDSQTSVSAIQLLHYTSSNPLGPDESSTNPLFNLVTRVQGVVFPNGTRSVLFFGTHGIGNYCYGDGDDCGDPADSSKGNHAYPYVYQVWAYDANDFVAVRNGSKSATSLSPYSVWTFNVPFERDDNHDIGGVAYDPDTSRIYFGQENGGGDNLPLIHAFAVDIGVRPGRPENLHVE